MGDLFKKRRGRPPQRPPEAVYVVEVTGWEWRYWIDRARHDFQVTPVVEYRNIIIHGTVRGPKLGKVTKAEVHIEPGWKLEELTQPKEGADGPDRLYLDDDGRLLSEPKGHGLRGRGGPSDAGSGQDPVRPRHDDPAALPHGRYIQSLSFQMDLAGDEHVEP